MVFFVICRLFKSLPNQQADSLPRPKVEFELTREAREYMGLLAPSACFFTAALLSSLGGKILAQIIPISES